MMLNRLPAASTIERSLDLNTLTSSGGYYLSNLKLYYNLPDKYADSSYTQIAYLLVYGEISTSPNSVRVCQLISIFDSTGFLDMYIRSNTGNWFPWKLV